ncbi:hypothetical protein VTO73DRAFT_591 [Trametes versicolor]
MLACPTALCFVPAEATTSHPNGSPCCFKSRAPQSVHRGAHVQGDPYKYSRIRKIVHSTLPACSPALKVVPVEESSRRVLSAGSVQTASSRLDRLPCCVHYETPQYKHQRTYVQTVRKGDPYRNTESRIPPRPPRPPILPCRNLNASLAPPRVIPETRRHASHTMKSILYRNQEIGELGILTHPGILPSPDLIAF